MVCTATNWIVWVGQVEKDSEYRSVWYLVLLRRVQGGAVDPLYRKSSVALQRGVQQGLHHAQVGVVQLRVLAHQPDHRFIRNCVSPGNGNVLKSLAATSRSDVWGDVPLQHQK